MVDDWCETDAQATAVARLVDDAGASGQLGAVFDARTCGSTRPCRKSLLSVRSPNPLPFPCEGAVAARVLLCATRDTRRRVSSERAAGEWAVPDGGHLQRFSPCEPEQIASERRRVQGPTSLMRRCSSRTRVCQEFDFRLRSTAGFGETRHFGGGDSDAEPEREQQDDHGPAHASRRARETSGRVRPSCRG
jgi:hypothetical protein